MVNCSDNYTHFQQGSVPDNLIKLILRQLNDSTCNSQVGVKFTNSVYPCLTDLGLLKDSFQRPFTKKTSEQEISFDLVQGWDENECRAVIGTVTTTIYHDLKTKKPAYKLSLHCNSPRVLLDGQTVDKLDWEINFSHNRKGGFSYQSSGYNVVDGKKEKFTEKSTQFTF